MNKYTQKKRKKRDTKPFSEAALFSYRTARFDVIVPVTLHIWGKYGTTSREIFY